MSRIPRALLVGRITLLLAACAVSVAAPAQDDSTEPPAQGVTADETESAEETAPSSQEAAAEPQPSSDTAAAADSPSSDQPEAQETSEPQVIPIDQEPVPPVAASASGPARLDDIVVTAQKRLQGAMDVPISMSVMTEQFIKDQGITSVAEALQFVPNFKVIEYLGTIRPQCRGFTVSQGNPAFEPPCGLALDGIAYARSSYFSAGLFDVERIEVLRGPQGTTFGKNTTAGVIALYTKDPTDAFVGNVDVQYGPSGSGGVNGSGIKRAEAGFGGPLIRDVVNFRLAFAQEDREGMMENTYHQTDPSVPEFIGGFERPQYRAKLLFPDVLGAEIKLLTEKTRVTPLGLPSKMVDVPEDSALAQYIRQYDPNYDFGRNWKGSGFQRGYNDTILTRHHGEVTSDIGGWDLALLGATGELTNDYLIDTTQWPERWVDSYQWESNPFVTAEVRGASPDFEGLLGLKDLFGLDLGSSRMLVGVFGQDTGLDWSSFILLRDAPTAGIVAAAVGVFIPDKPTVDAAWEQERQTGSQPGEWLYREAHQTTQTAAVFGQFTWDMTEKWTLDLGARISTEKKTSDWNVYASDPAPLLDPAGTRAFKTSKNRSEDSFQPKISVGYQLTDRINLFAHWARAQKGGGYNFGVATNPEEPDPTRSSENVGHLDFGPEQGTDWGFDFKSILLDNTLRLNLSLFRLTVDDFQVLTGVPGTRVFPGSTVRLPNGYSEVINIGKARAQGAEVDLQYLPTAWLTVIGALGYNDTEYLSAPLDSCGFNIEPADPETGRCDHTGFSFLETPKLSGSLTLDGHFPLAGVWGGFGDLMFLLGGTVEYTGSYYTTAYHPCCVQEAYERYRAQTGLSGATWSFRVTGLNLTNEYITPNVGSDPAFPSAAPGAPRSVFAQFSWNYW